MNIETRNSPMHSTETETVRSVVPDGLETQSLQRTWPDPMLWGTLFGLGSAVCYTGANVFLRAVSDLDPIWVSCVKSTPTVMLFAPWMAVRVSRGQAIIPPRKSLLTLVAAALLGHLGGNVAFQWSLGIVGIAVAVPLTLGSIIVSGAALGRIYLKESLTMRMASSILILTVAMVVLGWGAAQGESTSNASPASVASLTSGVLAACFAGFAYAVLGVAIRHGVKGQVSVTTTLVIVSLVGVVSLGVLSVWTVGVDVMRSTSSQSIALMLLAGICNAAAFLSLTKSLQLATVNYINSLNSTQVAMATIAGVVLFAEPVTTWLCAGVALTVIGLVTMKDRSNPRRRSATVAD